MLELAIAEAVEHAERMLKTFESGCAVAQDLLQMMIDKLEVVRQHAVASSNQPNEANKDPGGVVNGAGAAAGTGNASASPDLGAGAPLSPDQPTT